MKYLILCLLLLASPASAYLQIAQGDRIYMNETLDIRQAVSYPSYQIVWCAANNFDCDPPDQLIDTENGSLKKYWIDPSLFHYGTYYRWDGEWHRAENSVAFTIIPGKRPKNVTVNQTPVPNEIIKPIDGPYQYLIARGDSPTISFRLNQSDTCHLWIFSNVDGSYDIPLVVDNGTYSHTFSESDTFDMNIGEYNGYIQCDGNNGWQEIYFNNGSFETPYKKVKDVEVVSWNLLNAKRQFDDLVKAIPRHDDDLIPITISVVDPTITVTDVQQDEKKLYISGKTSWGNNSPITLKLDLDNYKLSADIALHAWDTFAIGSMAPRSFATALDLKKEELYVGPHEIIMNVKKNHSTSVSSYQFMVSDIYVMPKPTLEIKRMVYGKDWEGIPVKVEPTPTPEITEEPTPEPIEVILITSNETANITVTTTTIANVTTKPTEMPMAEDTIPTVPTGAGVVVASVCVALVMWRER